WVCDPPGWFSRSPDRRGEDPVCPAGAVPQEAARRRTTGARTYFLSMGSVSESVVRLLWQVAVQLGNAVLVGLNSLMRRSLRTYTRVWLKYVRVLKRHILSPLMRQTVM